MIGVGDGTVDGLFGRSDMIVLFVGLSTFDLVDEIAVVVAKPLAMINLFILDHNIYHRKIGLDHT